MKQYFIDKLMRVSKDIKRLKEHIISDVTDLKVSELSRLSENLKNLIGLQANLTTDCVLYCSVADVIEINQMVDKYSGDKLNLLSANSVRYAYQYSIKNPVTLIERDSLVTEFGYPLKEAKV
jgi:hypothetical protein